VREEMDTAPEVAAQGLVRALYLIDRVRDERHEIEKRMWHDAPGTVY
jgi:hypothetical protein